MLIALKSSAAGMGEAEMLASMARALSGSETLPGVIGSNLMQGPASQSRQQQPETLKFPPG